MESRKKNLVALGWRYVICPAAKAADPLSWIIFIAFLMVFIAGVVFRFSTPIPGGAHGFYVAHYGIFWYGAWALFVLATVGPILNLTLDRNEVPIAVLVGFGLTDLAIFIVISGFALTQDTSVAPATALLGATAGAGMVGIGWVVQQQSSARATRRTHTFNILMQSRLSTEFQANVRSRGKYFPARTRISEQDARLMTQRGANELKAELVSAFEKNKRQAREDAIPQLEAELKAAHDLIDAKRESMKALCYVMNFYEFLCAGILLRELDERMIKETLSDIASDLYNDTANVRALAKASQPAAYCNLDKLIGRNWTAR